METKDYRRLLPPDCDLSDAQIEALIRVFTTAANLGIDRYRTSSDMFEEEDDHIPPPYWE